MDIHHKNKTNFTAEEKKERESMNCTDPHLIHGSLLNMERLGGRVRVFSALSLTDCSFKLEYSSLETNLHLLIIHEQEYSFCF